MTGISFWLIVGAALLVAFAATVLDHDKEL